MTQCIKHSPDIILKLNELGGQNGIGIISNTDCCITNITGNKLSGKYNCGIRVKSPTGKIKVQKNTVKTSNPKSKKFIGISVDGCKKKTITIKSNKITGNNTSAGIYVTNSSAKIKGNKVKKSKSKITVVSGKYKVSM